VQADLIYDLGLHQGEDTEFYLKKGFRVVGLEANPALCVLAREKFAGPIAEGRLILVNKGLADRLGTMTFYESEHSVWGSFDPSWAERNRRKGIKSREIVVETTTMAALLETYGVPYYVKADIEGFDMVAIEGLQAAPQRPRFVSIESNKDSWKALLAEFDTLQALGYDRFKVVPQSNIPGQAAAQPHREGVGVEHRFPEHASGSFGEEAAGEWLTAEAAIETYRRIFWRYAIVGDDAVAPRWLRSLAWRLGMRPDWWDTHARLAGA
jgi:FkbM family methyltransferase